MLLPIPHVASPFVLRALEGVPILGSHWFETFVSLGNAALTYVFAVLFLATLTEISFDFKEFSSRIKLFSAIGSRSSAMISRMPYLHLESPDNIKAWLSIRSMVLVWLAPSLD